MVLHARAQPARPARVHTREVCVPLTSVQLRADLAVPANARGIVMFAHGSGSGRHSPRNRYVAETLHAHGLATLLADLLTDEEEQADRVRRQLRFDIPLLAGRLLGIGEWVWHHKELRELDCGYFGASTGAAAALIAAAGQYRIRAVVSRGGRPDLACAYLPRVTVPVLLLVGSRDEEVLKLNERALRALNVASRLEVIPRATHLFEEAGTLEAAAQHAARWFVQHLG
jgi:putative phosphoribosyl transferase